MAKNYVDCDRDTLFLLPPDMRDWLPETHLAWFVLDVVGKLDLAEFHSRHPNLCAGRAAYDPRMMLALLLYGYCTGVRSSRQIERLCQVDIAFRVIAGNNAPDHSTIARFRAEFEGQIAALFIRGLELCHSAGLGKLGVVALDGTKLAASASKQATKARSEIEAEVQKMLKEAKETDDAEDKMYGDARGDELPPELADPRSRKAKLEDALRRLEQKRKDELDRERQALADKNAERMDRAKRARHVNPHTRRRKRPRSLPQAEADLELAQAEKQAATRHREKVKEDAARKGLKRPWGFEPNLDAGVLEAQQELERATERENEIAGKASINTTDPDSSIMKGRDGYLQGYNLQAVASEDQIILLAEATTSANDCAQFIPMMEALKANLKEIRPDDEVGVILADAGYMSADAATSPGPDRLIAPARAWKLRKKLREQGERSGEPPPDATPAEVMEHRLLTKEGGDLYKKRAQTIEPVFGQIKEVRGIRRFMRRGKTAVDCEWKLIAFTHNLLKLFAHEQRMAVAHELRMAAAKA